MLPEIVLMIFYHQNSPKHQSVYNNPIFCIFMKYIEPTRVKVLMMLFFATGSIGIIIGLSPVAGSQTMILTFMGVVNIGLGAFFTYIFLTQEPKTPDKRKKKRKSD